VTENRIRCTVTRYSVVGDRLVETTTEEETGYEVVTNGADERWLYLGNCAASARLEDLRDAIERYGGWSAQAGTPPVKVECQAERRGRCACCPGGCEAGWGGRNYPKIYVSAEALLEVLT
jgi:hypothetical protein